MKLESFDAEQRSLPTPTPTFTPESTPLDYLPSERANNSTSWEDREREPALQH